MPLRALAAPLLAFLLVLSSAFTLATAASAGPPMQGFSDDAAAHQRQIEQQLDKVVTGAELRSWMKRMSSLPHHVGSPHGKANAELMAELFRSWGYDTRIETFEVLFPTPKVRQLELLAPERFVASLEEPAVEGDATSGQDDGKLPTYNAYSVDGDVEGELVYVNFGVPADYEELALRGVDVAGKIVIARYGGAWRGIKPKVAAEHGAIGCIIYSDPAGDGYAVGDIYPDGGWRGPHSVQRGSVLDFSAYGSDPLTPLVGATPDAPRLALEEATSLTKIPTLPISWADAEPLLRALGGHVVPPEWRGALPFAYHVGPGPARVHLRVEFNWDRVEIHDVIAVLEGSEHPDQWVIRGNHHDAWVYGATDPVSGMVAVLEEARAVAELAKNGSPPKRTVIYAAWDAEEVGLFGSSEWVETHIEELRDKAVAYINSDSNERGFFGAVGSHTLEKMINQIMREVADPVTGQKLIDRTRAATIHWGGPRESEEARSRPDLRLRPAGSGSDFGPFLQFAGIASLNTDYGGFGEYGQYHSIYDSFDHYVNHMDTDFTYGAALARTAGRVTLRLANAPVLPFDFGAFTDSVGLYVQELRETADTMRKATEQKNSDLADGTFMAVRDPRLEWVAPEPEAPVPFLNLAPLENALARLERAAAEYQKAWGKVEAGERTLNDAERAALNRILMLSERALTRPEGLPGRPWYRHQIYAPGVYTGYAPKTIPSVREAIEERRFADAEAQAVVVGETLERFAAEVERAAAVLAGGTGEG